MPLPDVIEKNGEDDETPTHDTLSTFRRVIGPRHAAIQHSHTTRNAWMASGSEENGSVNAGIWQSKCRNISNFSRVPLCEKSMAPALSRQRAFSGDRRSGCSVDDGL